MASVRFALFKIHRCALFDLKVAAFEHFSAVAFGSSGQSRKLAKSIGYYNNKSCSAGRSVVLI
jgi:hypothetical protein